MVLDCGFDLLGFDADVSLSGRGGTVLQQSLNQRNVESVFVVDLRCIPLAKTVGAAPSISIAEGTVLRVHSICTPYKGNLHTPWEKMHTATIFR